MKFEVNFNNEDNDLLLEELGAVWEEDVNATKYPPFGRYMIELNDFSDLEKLLNELDTKTHRMWSAVIGFDHPTIFFDDKV